MLFNVRTVVRYTIDNDQNFLDKENKRAIKSQKKTQDAITGFFDKVTFGLRIPKEVKDKNTNPKRPQGAIKRLMPAFFRSTAQKPGSTKVCKGYKEGSDDKWIQKCK